MRFKFCQIFRIFGCRDFFSRILWGGGGFLSVTLSCGYGVKFRFFVRGTFFSCAKTWFLIWDIWKIRYAFFEVHRSRFFSMCTIWEILHTTSLAETWAPVKETWVPLKETWVPLKETRFHLKETWFPVHAFLRSLFGPRCLRQIFAPVPGPEPTVVASALVFLEKLLILGTPKKANVSNPFFQFSEFRDFSRL